MAIRISKTMDPIMKAIKAVHTVTGSGASISSADLAMQRASQDLFASLATPLIGVSSEEFSIGDIACQIFTSDKNKDNNSLILYCHGGGYTCGSLKYAGVLGAKLAIYTQLKTISFEYRLAPENPYPAAIEDVMEVWNHLMYMGYGARDIIVAGDSAGGNLALELCIALKEAGRRLPGGLVLMSPWTDMTTSAGTYNTHADMDPMLTPEYVRASRKAYLGKYNDYTNPHFSPLFADFQDYPPTLIQVGTHEILLADSQDLAQVMKESGVNVELQIYDNCWHVFQQLPMRRSAKAMKAIGEFTDKIRKKKEK